MLAYKAWGGALEQACCDWESAWDQMRWCRPPTRLKPLFCTGLLTLHPATLPIPTAFAGCLPATLHRAAVAALLCLGGLLPAVAHYKTEGQARRRFMAASRPLFGLPRQPAAATAE